jgi:hypothetical protein
VKFKPSRSFLLSLVILFAIGGGYWWNTSGHASWQAWQAQRQRAVILRSAFGPDLPASVSYGSRTGKSDIAAITIEGHIPKEQFSRLLDRAKWKEIPIPEDYLHIMHLPSDTPKDYMTCYSGQIELRPAKLFWSDYAGVFLLTVE